MTTMRLPEGKHGQALALAIGIIGIVIAWLGVVQPLLDLYATRSEVLDRREVLAHRMNEILATYPEVERRAATGITASPMPEAILQGATDGLAGAALQTLVEKIATGVGSHLSSREVLTSQQVGAYRQVALRVTLNATWEVAMRLLKALERSVPQLFIDDLQFHVQASADRQHEPSMNISFVVLAFRVASPVAVPPPSTSAPPWTAR